LTFLGGGFALGLVLGLVIAHTLGFPGWFALVFAISGVCGAVIQLRIGWRNAEPGRVWPLEGIWPAPPRAQLPRR
jgi:hypothetical protein